MTQAVKDWGLGKTRLTNTPNVYDRTTGKDVATIFGAESDVWLVYNAPELLETIKRLCSTDALNRGFATDHDRKVINDARALVSFYETTIVRDKK